MDVTNTGILKPKIPRIETIKKEIIFQRIRDDRTANASIQYLAELLQRHEKQLEEQEEKIKRLEEEIVRLNALMNPPKKKSGRKQQEFYFNGALLDDYELIRLIDGGFITIRELEKDVGANKNVLRRRHERLKQKQQK